MYQIKPNVATGDFGQGFITPIFEPLKLDNLTLIGPDLNVTLMNFEAYGS